MGRYGWNQTILARSRISETARPGAAAANKLFPLLEYVGDTDQALPVRLTLKPIAGTQGRPLFPFGSSGIADLLTDPVVPGAGALPTPRAGWSRSNAGSPPPNPISGTPAYALVQWGVGEAPMQQLACDWPMCGASVELVASRVSVFGQQGPTSLFLPGTPQDLLLGAELGPSQGMGYNDEPLTFVQLAQVRNAGGSVQVAVPEFARSVEIWCPDTMDPTTPDFYEVTFAGMDPATSIACQTRLDFTLENRKPVELSVPGKAVVMIITGFGGADQMDAYLQWRIAP